MIEFAAVIQRLIVTPEATTLQLDISILDVSPLTALIDREVSVTLQATLPTPVVPESVVQPPVAPAPAAPTLAAQTPAPAAPPRRESQKRT